MSTKTKKAYGATALLLLAVLFLAMTMLSDRLLHGARLDLTENQLYTISHGTRTILGQIDEPIDLYYYFSDRASSEAPSLRTYANRVQEMLEEFAAHAGSKLRLQVIDPLQFSDEQDDAARFGLQAIPINAAGDSIYFGLAGSNSVGDEAVIPFFQPDKETFLEYDLAKLIYSLDHPDRTVIGLVSSLPMNGGFDPVTRQPQEAWAISSQIESLFELRNIEMSQLDHIDDDVDVLMIVHPKQLSEPAQYAIDQYVLGGGRALIFIDPHAEADVPPNDPANPMAAFMASRSSNLEKLFAGWGIAYDPLMAVLDAERALNVGARPGAPPVLHLAVLGLDEANLAQDDLISGGLGSVNLAFAGSLAVTDDSTLSMSPLITASERSMTVTADRFRLMTGAAELLEEFGPQLLAGDGNANPPVLAARFSGDLGTAFPGGPHIGLPTTSADGTVEEPDAPPAGHLEQSDGPVNVVIIADTDMLTDRLWVQVQNFFGQKLLSSFAHNGDFIINALDNLTGSNDLISIRGRATYSRPFERVEALKRAADAEFRDTEKRLQDELTATEERLAELQSGRQDDDLLILSDAQRAEIEQFREQQLQIRKELRSVRRELDREIETLGRVLKFVNIALVPLLLTVFALAAVFLRSRRRATSATEVAQ